MYPSIKIKMTKKETGYFTKRLTTSTKKTINLFLEIIRFEMSSTLISYDGEYCDYQWRENKEHGLSIGGHELDFLADLVASYLFKKNKDHFRQKIYYGIYRDDGLVILKGGKRFDILCIG